jgi:hypothetical protein
MVRKMAKQQEIEAEAPPGYKEDEEKVYKNPILYLRKSKKGEHLYAFNVEAKAEGLADPGEMVLGDKVGSLIVNVSDVVKLVDGKTEWIKVSVMSAEGRD